MLTLLSAYHYAASGPHAHGPWFGALTVLVYGYMFGSGLRAARRHDRWTRKHHELDTAFMVSLLFVSLGSLTPLALLWCAAIAVIATLLAVLLGRHRTRGTTKD